MCLSKRLKHIFPNFVFFVHAVQIFSSSISSLFIPNINNRNSINIWKDIEARSFNIAMTSNHTKKRKKWHKIKNTVDDVYCIEPDSLAKNTQWQKLSDLRRLPIGGMFHFVSVYIFFSFYFLSRFLCTIFGRLIWFPAISYTVSSRIFMEIKFQSMGIFWKL